jgi:HSP20 family protein
VSDGLDSSAIEANYDAGVLTLELPVEEQAKPRPIEIGRSGGRKTIEGSARRSG